MSRKFIFGGSFGSAVPLLLDLYPATAAFSVRKLRTAYTGACMRVRRSSDNTEQDIGFVGNNLDTAALLSFVGAGDGFVTTWYDQQGSNNASQSTLSRQLRIASLGVMDSLNSLPSLTTYATNILRNFQTPLSHLQNLPVSIINVYKIDALPTNAFSQVTFNIGGSGNPGGGGRYEQSINNTGDTGTIRRNTSGAVSVSQNINVFDAKIHASYFTLSQLNQRVNGLDSAGVAYTGIPFNVATNFNLVNANGSESFFHGNKRFQEIIIWLSNESPNRAAIETNINNYYGIY
jgi:hypothetical protein